MTVSIEMDGDEAKLWRSFQKIVDQQKKLEKGTKQLADTSKKADREQRAMLREAKRLWEETRTPQEKYAATQKRLNDLVRRGHIDQDTANRKLRQMAEQQKRVSTTGQSAFGGAALGQLKNFAAGFISLSAAVGVARKAMEVLNEESERAQQASRDRAGGGGLLVELAQSPQELKKLENLADKWHKLGVGQNYKQASEFVHAIASSEQLSDIQLFGNIERYGIGKAGGAELANSVQTIQAAFGAEEAGDARRILNNMFGASRSAPSQAAPVLRAAAKAGAVGASLGLTDEDTLAAATALSKASSVDEARPQLEQLFATFDQQGITEGTILERVRELKAQIGDRRPREVITEKRALKAFNIFANLDEDSNKALQAYEQAFQDMEQARRTDAVGQKLKMARGSEHISADVGRKVSEAEEQAAFANADAVNLQTTLRNISTAEKNAGYNPLLRFYTGAQRKVSTNVNRLLGYSPDELKQGLVEDVEVYGTDAEREEFDRLQRKSAGELADGQQNAVTMLLEMQRQMVRDMSIAGKDLRAATDAGAADAHIE